MASLVVLGSFDYLEREGIRHGEYYALVLFAAAGMGVMASANELITAFIGLEMSSIASYIGRLPPQRAQVQRVGDEVFPARLVCHGIFPLRRCPAVRGVGTT